MVKNPTAVLLMVLAATPAAAQTWQNFESGPGDWFADNGVWEVGTPTAGPPACYEGTRCAGTVLGANYPKTNSRLISPAVRLAQGTPLNPVLLRFRHWFSWAAEFGSDSGILQVSTYNSTQGTWSAWADVGSPFLGASSVWTLHVADLTAYSGQLVRIAFHHRGTGAQSATTVPPSSHGWFVDNIEVAGTAVPPARYSTLQDFEMGQGSWFADNGVWEVGLPTAGPPGCHGGVHCAGTVLNGNYPKTNSRLVSPPFQVPQGTAERPVLLRFWQWFSWAVAFGSDSGVVQVSVYDATLATWGAWADAAPFMVSASGVWSLNIVDLTRFSGSLVRVGFYHRGTGAQSGSVPPPTSTGWYVDDIALGVSVPDADNDGLPDDWETQFGLDPTSAMGDNGGAGDPDADGLTNLEEYTGGTHPRGFYKRYLAEGAVNAFFDVRLALLNVGTAPARVLRRFLQPGGAILSQFDLLPVLRRRTLTRTDLTGLVSPDFSTVVESDQPVVVDRTMSWDASGFGSHAESAVASPSTTWYLAEGSTSGDFALFYLLQNPNPAGTVATVRYLRPSGQAPIERQYTLAPSSRTTIPVDLQGPELASTDVSAVITTGLPIIVERAMYMTRLGQPFAAGHGAAGVTAPATSWFLAEGATGPFFDLFILLANPGAQPAQVTVDYLLMGGTTHTKSYTVPANGRATIWVDDEQIPAGSGVKPLDNVAVSSTITSTNGVPIIVERAMWWPSPAMTPAYWMEAHNSPGATTPATGWALAEGEVGGPHGAETYILIANTSPFTGDVRVRLCFEDGTSADRTFVLPPRSRTNVSVSAEFPESAGRRFGAVVESLGGTPAQIVVERAMYTSPGGVTWAAGTSARATPLP